MYIRVYVLYLVVVICAQVGCTLPGKEKAKNKLTKSELQYMRRQANVHQSRVREEGKCRDPKPRVVHVHPNGVKKFLPPCTVLHVCDNSSGCCFEEGMRCVAKSVQEVDLHFMTIQQTADGRLRHSVEKLTFTNHTECHCQRETDDKKAADLNLFAN